MPDDKLTLSTYADLNAKQAMFVNYIVQGYSQRESAIMAGYSKRSADTQGSRLADKLCKVIEAKREEISKKVDVTAESLVYDLEMIKQSAYKADKLSEAINAINAQSRILGLDKPSKKEITHHRTIIKLPSE